MKNQELKQIKLTDSIGKTIEGVKVSSYKHLIKYTDGTFSFFSQYCEWDSYSRDDIKIEYSKFIEKLKIRRDGTTYFTNTQQMFIDLGLLDGDLLIEHAKERIDREVKYCNDNDMATYLRLKEKFGEVA